MPKSLHQRLIRLSNTKPVYYLDDNHNTIVKEFPNRKSMKQEYELHWKAQHIVPCPKLYDAIYEHKKGYLIMERIHGNTIYELYGQDPYEVPNHVWAQIHSIVHQLFANDIHYIDVTPFNFMIEESTEKVYILDFGNAYAHKVHWFLKECLDGEHAWNSDFQ